MSFISAPQRGQSKGYVEECVLAGQVRLFAPMAKQGCRPLFFAVLAEKKDNSFLIAPFGRFSEPAVPGELMMVRECQCLRVLCLWNACEVTANVVRGSWIVDELDADELESAMMVLEHDHNNAVLPDDLKRRLGPPLYHPDDPRHIYRRLELALMIEVQSDMLLWPGTNDSKHDLPLAAEEREEYGDDATQE